MPGDPNKPSFSRGRKWTIGLNVALAVLVVLGVAVMANYLSGRHSHRFYLSTTTRVALSPRTLLVLNSLTNSVQVTVYYDKDDSSYGTIVDLLKEYRAQSSKLDLEIVDYRRDSGRAEQVKAQYNLGAATNLIIFAAEGTPPRILEGDKLTQKVLEQVPGEEPNQLAFRRKPVAFWGERMCTAALLTIANPKPMHAFVLQGHGEHGADHAADTGFTTFASLLRQNNVQVHPLWLVSTNTIPAECNLLVIPGPTSPLPQSDLDEIERYLAAGGRLLAMFNFASTNRPTGLENVLANWGVHVSNQTVTDPQLTTAPGADVVVLNFSDHPAVSLLSGSQLQLILPRAVSKRDPPVTAENGFVAREIAFSGPQSYLGPAPGAQPPQPLPLMVAVEKGEAANAALGDGRVTRIVVVGDSLFLVNNRIEAVASRDFVELAAGWLLERSVLPEGLGPRPVTEYRVLIPKVKMQTLQWILLGALPGSILLFGGIVWLSRRK